MVTGDDCTSVGFSGEGRCIEPAVADGQCAQHGATATNERKTLNLHALIALREAATPGTWSVHDHVIVETTWGDVRLDVAGTSFSDTDTHTSQDRANAALIAAAVNALPHLIAATRWKAETLLVMAGLQEVGRALGLPLGEVITGRAAVDAALDLRNAADREAVLRAWIEAHHYPDSRGEVCMECDGDRWPCGTIAALAAADGSPTDA